jgi:DNA-3-methyladenine glycosylase I
VARCLADPGIVRSRAKIEAAVGNARAYLRIAGREGFDDFLWRRVDGRPVQNRFRTSAEVPAETALSQAIARDLRAEGFRFAGPVIVYAFMQATGMVNDHLVTCPAHDRVAAMA